MSKKLRNALFSAGLVVGSLVLAVVMVRSREAAPRSTPPVRSPSVETVAIRKVDGPLKVRGGGNVRARAEIDLAPQVSGRVAYVSPAMVSGGRVSKGEVLVRIEKADYENAVLQARAQVAEDSVGVQEAMEEAHIARAEYQQFLRRQRRMAPLVSGLAGESPAQPEASSLTLRGPQLQASQASLARSEAQLADAELALSRTDLRAPFDGVVRSESVDVGSYAVQGQSVARLFSIDVEVKIPLSDADASLLPGLWGASEKRLSASAMVDFGQGRYRWDGYVHRAEAALDEQTRTISVVVRVPDSFRGGAAMGDSREGPAQAPPLLVGQFVEVELDGAEGEFFALPRRAVRPGDEVWIVEDNRIRIELVQVIQRSEREAFVAGALMADQRVVTDGIDLATDGMVVQDRGEAGS